MAMDNELRKILLREQDLRFVTDTLGQYLGKKAEERKYYADQAHEERMAKKETETKPLEREQFYYDVAPESQWSPEFKKYVEDNRLNVTGGESAKLFDITDTQSHQFQSFPEFTLRSKPSDSQTTASTKMYKWNDPITGNRVIGNLDKFNLFNIENPDNPITEIFTISSEPSGAEQKKKPVQRYMDLSAVDFEKVGMETVELQKLLLDKYGLNIKGNKGNILSPYLNDAEVDELTQLLGQKVWVDKDSKKAKDTDKLKKGDLVYFIPTKSVNIDGRIYKPGEEALIPVSKAYIHQQNGSGDIQLTKTDTKSLNWNDKQKEQFKEYKRLRKHVYDQLQIVVDPLNESNIRSLPALLRLKYGDDKTYQQILKELVFPDETEYQLFLDLDKEYGHIYIVDDAPSASTQKQFQWTN